MSGTDVGRTRAVQLLLAQFATLKNDAGHRRYVAFRNARGLWSKRASWTGSTAVLTTAVVCGGGGNARDQHG
eukprot:544996-Rhodomonas_salina.2